MNIHPDEKKHAILLSSKYYPKSSSDLLVKKDKVESLKFFLKGTKVTSSSTKLREQHKSNQNDSHQQKFVHSPLCILRGPSGSGKSCTLHLLCRELSIRILEFEMDSDKPSESNEVPSLSRRYLRFLEQSLRLKSLDLNNFKIIETNGRKEPALTMTPVPSQKQSKFSQKGIKLLPRQLINAKSSPYRISNSYISPSPEGSSYSTHRQQGKEENCRNSDPLLRVTKSISPMSHISPASPYHLGCVKTPPLTSPISNSRNSSTSSQSYFLENSLTPSEQLNYKHIGDQNYTNNITESLSHQIILIRELPYTLIEHSPYFRQRFKSIINQLVNTPQNPNSFTTYCSVVICIDNNEMERKALNKLLSNDIENHPGVVHINFNPFTTKKIEKLLHSIVRQEGYSNEALENGNIHLSTIAESAKGDLRLALNSLQFSLIGLKNVNQKLSKCDTNTHIEQETMNSQLFDQKDNLYSMFHLVGKFLYNKRLPKYEYIRNTPPYHESLHKTETANNRSPLKNFETQTPSTYPSYLDELKFLDFYDFETNSNQNRISDRDPIFDEFDMTEIGFLLKSYQSQRLKLDIKENSPKVDNGNIYRKRTCPFNLGSSNQLTNFIYWRAPFVSGSNDKIGYLGDFVNPTSKRRLCKDRDSDIFRKQLKSTSGDPIFNQFMNIKAIIGVEPKSLNHALLFPKFYRPPLYFNPDLILEQNPCDIYQLIELLHHNFLQFFSSMQDIAEVMENLSFADAFFNSKFGNILYKTHSDNNNGSSTPMIYLNSVVIRSFLDSNLHPKYAQKDGFFSFHKSRMQQVTWDIYTTYFFTVDKIYQIAEKARLKGISISSSTLLTRSKQIFFSEILQCYIQSFLAGFPKRDCTLHFADTRILQCVQNLILKVNSKNGNFRLDHNEALTSYDKLHFLEYGFDMFPQHSNKKSQNTQTQEQDEIDEIEESL